jgi:hypothetical protein
MKGQGPNSILVCHASMLYAMNCSLPFASLSVLASFTIFHIIPNMLLKIPNVIKSARVPLEMVLKNEI